MRLTGKIALSLTGLIVGFFGAVLVMDLLVSRKAFEVRVSLRADTLRYATLSEGWGRTSIDGTVMQAKSATITVPLPNAPVEDLVLDVEAMASTKPVPHLEVRVQDRQLDRWPVAKSRVKRLVLPMAVAGTAPKLTLTFVTDGKPGTITVSDLIILGISNVGDFASHVDSCTAGFLSGWAKAGSAAFPVTVRRVGVPDLTVMPNVERQDLEAAGFPRDAGFHVELKPPPKPGESIEVRFASGPHLRGSPCRYK
jgi:hypothetical protein